MDHHGAALAEPRPCGHWKASPVSPPVRVLYRAPLKRAIQVRWGDPNSGPFLPAPGPRGDVRHRRVASILAGPGCHVSVVAAVRRCGGLAALGPWSRSL
ncbi:hypothetical protein MRX96_011001 [Rhipicephalus microplus]